MTLWHRCRRWERARFEKNRRIHAPAPKRSVCLSRGRRSLLTWIKAVRLSCCQHGIREQIRSEPQSHARRHMLPPIGGGRCP
ncbi:hypothetical protein RR11_1161 [Ruegeria sp. R11]|nr:hypothetical protein RR11_1161 [Ruegeria sp. R11]